MGEGVLVFRFERSMGRRVQGMFEGGKRKSPSPIGWAGVKVFCVVHLADCSIACLHERSSDQQVIAELQELPESDRQRVLDFLQSLRRQRRVPPAVAPRRSRNPAIKEVDGMLVFTGEIGDPDIDWVQVVRDERDAEILRQATGHLQR